MAFKDFASGLFGGLGSVISGDIGAKTTADTNKTNLKINQMNNDFNAREAVNSANMIFNGIGSGLDTYTRYQNGKVFRNRDYGDWSVIEDYMPNPDGGYIRNKTKRRRR